ncbi:MAG: type IV pilin protein [Thermoleophilia bacterium]|jgi:Tfp pilus assembly protein PilE
MMRRTSIALFLTTAVLALPLLTVSGCNDESTDTGSAGTAVSISNEVSPQDRAARIAAQSQLRNAQMAEEGYFAQNGRYASTAADLRSVDQRLSAKIQVQSGSASGYEISIEASDSARSVFIIRKNGSRTEHIDENGDSW